MKRTLLHVDDSDDELFLFRRALGKTDLPWHVESIQGGEKALEYLRQVQSGERLQPDLLLLDLKMPVVNGFALLERLRTNLPALAAVVLSSSELPEDRNRARQLGAVAYVEKAAIPTELIALLRDWPSQDKAARQWSEQ